MSAPVSEPMAFAPAAAESVPFVRTSVPAVPELKPVGVQGSAVEPETPLRPALHLVPAGQFLMGSSGGEREQAPDERQHPVRITRALLMARTEITQGQWEAVIGTRPSWFKACGPRCPVDSVSWFDAVAFANALSALEGRTACYRTEGCSGRLGAGCGTAERPRQWCMGQRCARVESVAGCTGYRLPTEAEWEYAARGGTYELMDPGPDLLRAHARFAENSSVEYGEDVNCSDHQGKAVRCGVHPVGELLPNAWGLHDMLGNVAEWCEDWYDAEYPVGKRHQADPRGPGAGRLRTLRGASWYASARWVHPARRDSADPARRTRGTGFRVLRAAD